MTVTCSTEMAAHQIAPSKLAGNVLAAQPHLVTDVLLSAGMDSELRLRNATMAILSMEMDVVLLAMWSPVISARVLRPPKMSASRSAGMARTSAATSAMTATYSMVTAALLSAQLSKASSVLEAMRIKLIFAPQSVAMGSRLSLRHAMTGTLRMEMAALPSAL
jgi:RecA/RadA recombinase